MVRAARGTNGEPGASGLHVGFLDSHHAHTSNSRQASRQGEPSSGGPVNKSELVEAIAAEAEIDKSAAEQALKATLDVITDAVASGEKVTVPGFGTFERRDRAAREGRNPQTGDTIKIAKTKVPAFKPGSSFKSYVAMSKKDQADHRKTR
jgi:DNA-binding protein HU-beta